MDRSKPSLEEQAQVVVGLTLVRPCKWIQYRFEHSARRIKRSGATRRVLRVPWLLFSAKERDMWASYLWHLFARPAKRVSPAAAIPVVPSATRAPRAAAPDLALQMSVTRTDTELIIREKGDARFECVRAVSDGSLGPAACRSR